MHTQQKTENHTNNDDYLYGIQEEIDNIVKGIENNEILLTQEHADKIVKGIENELEQIFVDRSNVTLRKAKEIAKYCDKKYKEYDSEKNSERVQFAYWYHLARKYKRGVEEAEKAVKAREERQKNERSLFNLLFEYYADRVTES